MVKNKHRGFTYIGALFLVAITGISAMSASVLWSNAIRADREEELLFVGGEFRKAIMLYYYRTPGGVKRYPQALEDLLEDHRFPYKARYLRKVYRDPMTNNTGWGLIRAPDGGIMGVYSTAKGTPRKKSGFSSINISFNGKQTYADWKFIHDPQALQKTPLN